MTKKRSPTISRAVKFISNETGMGYRESQQIVRAVLRSFTSFVGVELSEGRKVVVHGLGTFKLRHQKGWVAERTLKTKDASGNFVSAGIRVIENPEADYAHFVPAPALKNKIWSVRKPIRKIVSEKV